MRKLRKNIHIRDSHGDMRNGQPARAIPGEDAATWRRKIFMKSEWNTQDGYQEIVGLDCFISLISRPAYCDRGNFLAQIYDRDGSDPRRLNIDFQDGWPRYYMTEENAKEEIELWLKKRKQWIDA